MAKLTPGEKKHNIRSSMYNNNIICGSVLALQHPIHFVGN